MSSLVCSDCGITLPLFDVEGASAACPDCGGSLLRNHPSPTALLPHAELSASTVQEDASTVGETNHYPLTFTGTTSEYFRIWIVNTLLTLVTFGIYAAWAKVRNRQYLYANTRLAGHSFDYLADPMAILRGNLILAAGLILYGLSDYFFTAFSGVIVLLFYLALPWLIYKSLRFKAHNSAWRNIRFRFLGDLGDSYLTFLLLPIAIPFTLGILYPYWTLCQRRYFFRNMAFGQTRNEFAATAGPFYLAYLIALIVGGVLLAALSTPMGVLLSQLDLEAALSEGEGSMTFIYIAIAFFLIMQLVANCINQIVYARTMNHCWQTSSLGKIQFESRLHGGRLLWIRLTNILAILCSFGLLAPWAKIRRTRYLLSCLTLVSDADLSEFSASAESDNNAVGDVASDAFDFEIGL